MTKEELRRYSSIQRELADIARRLKALEENKGCHGMAYGDTPHQRGEPLSEAQRYVEKKETLEELYRKKYRILLEAQTAVENAIESLPPELRRLMRYRYLDGMTCEQVCVEMPCSWDTFHRWHKKALAMLE
nr:MAG TPA: Protein of unknown function (DUF722) [Caudoviricetes sp.]